MKTNLSSIASTFLLIFAVSINVYGTAGESASKPAKRKSTLGTASHWLRNQPVEFLENKGQVMNSAGLPANNVLFTAEAPGVNLYVTEEGLTYVQTKYNSGSGQGPREPGSGPKMKPVQCERIDMVLAGATITRENVIKEEPGAAHFNFLYGPGDQSIYDVKKYRRLTIRNVYPGIDWVLYNTSSEGFKYDFVVHPGADPGKIEMIYRSQHRVTNNRGTLQLLTSLGQLSEQPPVSYIKEGRSVSSSYRVNNISKKETYYESSIGFNIGKYNQSETLVIDPELLWSTFYGGTSFEGTYCIEADTDGNVYLCGYLGSNNFPLKDAGTYIDTVQGSGFIVKFDNDGVLLWSTYFKAQVYYLDTDPNNNLLICGGAGTNLPVQNAGGYYQSASAGGNDAFICRFNNAGAVTWCTYFGGSSYEYATAITCDASGNILLTGTSSSTNFPLMNGGGYFDGTGGAGNNGFAAKFSNTGALQWSTFVKNINQPVCTSDLAGNFYIVGSAQSTTASGIPLQNAGGTGYFQSAAGGSTDGFIMKFSGGGNLVWSTYYGGSNMDRTSSVQTDKSGNVFVCGVTSSTNLPVLNAGTYFKGSISGISQDMFILKFDNSATLKWGTYYGGTRNDQHYEYDNLAIDTCGNVFFGFTTNSRNVPFQLACDSGGMFDNTIDTSTSTTNNSVYLSRFSNTGVLMWSTLFGGDGNSFRTTLGADRFGYVFYSGEWNGVQDTSSYPTMWPGGNTYTQTFMGYEDLYVAKFSNKPVTQTFTYSAVCISAQTNPPILPPGFATGGTFSASPGASVDPVTGVLYPSASSPGTHTITYRQALCYCPGAIADVGTATVNLMAAPVLTISGANSICTGEKRTYTLTGATSFTWQNASTQPTISITAPATSTAPIILTVTSTENPLCVAVQNLIVNVNKCVGLQEFAGSRVSIYPNPNTGQFTIESEKQGSFKLVSEMGQLIRNIEFTESNGQKVQLTGLSPGLYFLEGEGPKGKSSIKIVVTE